MLESVPVYFNRREVRRAPGYTFLMLLICP